MESSSFVLAQAKAKTSIAGMIKTVSDFFIDDAPLPAFREMTSSKPTFAFLITHKPVLQFVSYDAFVLKSSIFVIKGRILQNQ